MQQAPRPPHPTTGEQEDPAIHGVNSFLTAGLVVGAVSHAGAVGVLVAANRAEPRPRRVPVAGPLLAAAAGAATARVVVGDGAADVLFATALVVATLVAHRILCRFRRSAVLVWVTLAVLLGFLAGWGTAFLLDIPVSPLTRDLLMATVPLAVLTVPVTLVRNFQDWEILCRHLWPLPYKRLVERVGSKPPRVSVHVPTHAEPPEVVIATLDALARLGYPDFEVLVVDNNTADPALWRPVEDHCATLGSRFRFLHVEGLAGAKAGALNLALTHTDAAAELVAVVDADYQVEPDFLSDLVGHFDDGAVGFVQTPHAYRGWEDSPYLRMCRWEYAYFYATSMVSRDQRGAGITVGTMCLIRRRALEQAGGWAEWCLTEDSELAVRIHALGYSSLYLNRVYGRGLIPETFAGYKTQRFRWTYGPIQELRRHARLFVPGRARTPSQLSPVQRLLHGHHGLDNIVKALPLLTTPLTLAIVGSMVLHREIVPTPLPLWIAATVLLVVPHVLRWQVYRMLGARSRDVLGATLAGTALTYAMAVASLFAVIGRSVPWQRTDKFRPARRGLRALGGVRGEIALAVGSATAAALALVDLPRDGIATMLAIGLILQAVLWLAAPIVAMLAERDIARRGSAAVG